MTTTLAEMMKMSGTRLDDLFSEATPGPIPVGDARGTALIFPGTVLSRALAGIVRWFFWQGKVFDDASATLVNKVSLFGIRAIKAIVSPGVSWLDGRECIVLDYSKTSWVARKIRDEIRLVAPGTYLGKVFWGKKHICDFVIEFTPQSVEAQSELTAPQ